MASSGLMMVGELSSHQELNFLGQNPPSMLQTLLRDCFAAKRRRLAMTRQFCQVLLCKAVGQRDD
jgi:hypothetical protein